MRNRLARLVGMIGNADVAVVGDILLDEYITGDTTRVSPEAPHPVILEHGRSLVPGGAANVARNITSLGGKVALYGVTGDDQDGAALRRSLAEVGLEDGGVRTVPGRPTTRKTRMIARGTQVLRVDHETTSPIDKAVTADLAERIIAGSADTVVISDYAKGVVTAELVRCLVASGKRVIVDPKTRDFGSYAGAYLVTPNAREMAEASGGEGEGIPGLESPARGLMERHGIGNVLVTLGPDGMALIEGGQPLLHIHARTREVYDVTGAGDTVIAVTAAMIAGGATLPEACEVANIAAGVVVGKHQTAVTTPDEILAYAFGATAAEKIVTAAELMNRLAELRRRGMKVVFTNGCFDLLHVGHITYLNEARALGDVLVIGLNTDRSVRDLKGPSRPIVPEEERSHLLAALECVDFVVLFDEPTPMDLIGQVRPDILVKGADYSKNEVVGASEVESWGGEVRLIPLVDNVSTTKLITRIRESGIDD